MSSLIREQGFKKHLKLALSSAQHYVESGTQSVFTERDVNICRCVLLNDPINNQGIPAPSPPTRVTVIMKHVAYPEIDRTKTFTGK